MDERCQEQVHAGGACLKQRSREMDFEMQVFISEGMPEGVLRQLFKQALDDKPEKSVL